MTTEQLLIALFGAGGGGAALKVLVDWARDMTSGRAQAEKDENQSLIRQRDDAWILLRQEREAHEAEKHALEDEQARLRGELESAHARARVVYEYASRLRRVLFEQGLMPEDWP